MSVTMLGELLDRAWKFEHFLEAYYADLRDRATRDGVRLLTCYLARHRRHLPEALECLTRSQIKSIRRTPCKYNGPEFDPSAIFEGTTLPSAVKADRLLCMAVEFVEVLAGFYRWISRQPLSEETCSLFGSLLRIEESHVVELKKIKAMDYF